MTTLMDYQAKLTRARRKALRAQLIEYRGLTQRQISRAQYDVFQTALAQAAYRIETPVDDLDERPHGSDRFGNPCECDDCQWWDFTHDLGNGHRADQVCYSASVVFVTLALGGLLLAGVAAWQAWRGGGL